MIKIYSPQKIEQILSSLEPEINDICSRYKLPPAFLKAILTREMKEIDFLDLIADTAVFCNWQRAKLTRVFPDLSGKESTRGDLLRKYDSSTGYGQICARTAIQAIRFAIERGLTTTEALGLGKDRSLSVDSPADRWEVWSRLHKEVAFNLTCSALNVILSAWEMTGKTDFTLFTPEDIKLTFTRYNADVRQITPYGEEAYQSYLHYC